MLLSSPQSCFWTTGEYQFPLSEPSTEDPFSGRTTTGTGRSKEIGAREAFQLEKALWSEL